MATSIAHGHFKSALTPFVSQPRSTRRGVRQHIKASHSACEDVTSTSARRRSVIGAAAGALILLKASHARAFLGFGEPSQEDVYKEDTTTVLKDVSAALSLDKNDPNKEEAINKIRKETNGWVAKYRRDNKFAGRPSYGNTYSALNALAGHFNSFGPTAPLPKKRLERIQKELEDATKMLGRGR